MKSIDQIWGSPRERWRTSAVAGMLSMGAWLPQARADVPAASPAAASASAAVVLRPAAAPTGTTSARLPNASAPNASAPNAPSAPGTVIAPAAAATRPSPLNPTPAEFPQASAAPSSSELDTLLARVAALRSRIEALTSAMFASRLKVEVRTAGDTARLEALHVSLDGGVVYTAPARAVFDRPEVVFEHAVAPGAHVVAIEVERHDAQNPQFSTWQESRFVVIVPEKKLLWTRVDVTDESNMAEDFQADHAGKYELAVKLQAEVTE